MFGRRSSTDQELVPGQEYYFKIVVAPLGLPGKQMVQEVEYDCLAEETDTLDSVEEYLKDEAIQMWLNSNPRSRPDEYYVVSFEHREL